MKARNIALERVYITQDFSIEIYICPPPSKRIVSDVGEHRVQTVKKKNVWKQKIAKVFSKRSNSERPTDKRVALFSQLDNIKTDSHTKITPLQHICKLHPTNLFADTLTMNFDWPFSLLDPTRLIFKMFIGRQNKIVDLWQLVPFISAHTKLTDTIHELINNSSPSRYLRNLSLVVKPSAH